MIAQPQHATGQRQHSLALVAAQRGRPAYMRHPMDARRAVARRHRRRKPRGRYSSPLHKILRVRRSVQAR